MFFCVETTFFNLPTKLFSNSISKTTQQIRNSKYDFPFLLVSI